MQEKFYVHQINLRTQNCSRKFIKNILPEKRKENMKPSNRDLNRDQNKHLKYLKSI